LALVSENSINIYALNVQEPFSEQLDAPEGVPLNVSVDDDMSLWTISNMGDVLILQNRLKNITYQLGTDVLGSVVLADVYFNPEGPVLISYNDVNKLQQWQRDQAQPAILELPNDLQNITNLAISSDGNRLVVSYCDEPNPNQPQTQCYVRILNRSARNKFLTEQQVNTYPAEILKLDFGLAGETLIVGAGDGNSYLIDIPTEKQYFIPLQGIAFALNPQGKTLSIGTADGKLILWDIAAAQEIGALPINSSAPMTSLAYAPDAKTLFAAFSNRVYMAFDVDFDHWFTRLCNIVGRDMTEEEWRQFIPDSPYQPICSPVLSATPIPNP
jgi:WD40 repeat protein